MTRNVYYISGNTGLLAKDAGKSILSQFPKTHFKEQLVPFVRTLDDAKNTLATILEQPHDSLPIVFSTIFDSEINAIFVHDNVILFNICEPFISQIENILGEKATRETGSARNLDKAILNDRVDAIHYTIAHDDGTALREYEQADLIILGVSRAGKTPISVFLATQMGVKTANYPLVENDLAHCNLPEEIVKNKHKVIGLTISPDVLQRFRDERFEGSSYAQISTCKREIIQARRLFDKYKIPVVYSDGRSIEETATHVAQVRRLKWNPSF